MTSLLKLNAKLNTHTYSKIAVYKIPSVMVNVLGVEGERTNLR
jgi:hypothetical protein